jgi:hypothetical protein
MDPVILRALERLLDAALGGLSIYLGYKLFLRLPDKTDSQGKVILPGNISIYLSRVGPGVFFALFGAAVIALSLHSAIRYEKNPAQNPTGDMRLAKETYIGIQAGQPGGDAFDLENRRSEVRWHIYALNQIPGMLRPDLTPEQQSDVSNGLVALKLELIKGVWDTDWGDYTQFAKWARLDDPAALAEGFPAAAVGLYTHGVNR